MGQFHLTYSIHALLTGYVEKLMRHTGNQAWLPKSVMMFAPQFHQARNV